MKYIKFSHLFRFHSIIYENKITSIMKIRTKCFYCHIDSELIINSLFYSDIVHLLIIIVIMILSDLHECCIYIFIYCSVASPQLPLSHCRLYQRNASYNPRCMDSFLIESSISNLRGIKQQMHKKLNIVQT